MAAVKKPQIIRDIRIIDSPTLKGHSLEILTKVLASQAAFRFACKLREEHSFLLGPAHHLYIIYSTELKPGEMVIDDVTLASWAKSVTVGISLESAADLESNVETFTITTLAAALARMAMRSHLDTAPIEIVKQELLAQGQETPVQLKRLTKETRDYRIEPYYKIKGRGIYAMQLFVKVIDLKTQISGERLFLEAGEHELRSLVSALSVKDGKVIAKPGSGMSNKWTIDDYNWRGFEVPVEMLLSDIFAN